MHPYFSIIVPVYNMYGKMNLCYDSLRNQSYMDFEVVFINDGSTDDTGKQLESFCTADIRFRIVNHVKNMSLQTARYTGMKNAKGEYVLFVDGDDSISTETLQLIYDKLSKNPVDILRFGNKEIYLDNTGLGDEIKNRERVRMPIKTNNLLEAMFRDDISPNVVKNCYSKALIERALCLAVPFYCNMSEDIYWSTIFYLCCESDDVLSECLYFYRIGIGMSTKSKDRTSAELNMYVNQIDLCFDYIAENVKKYAPESLKDVGVRYDFMMNYLLRVFIIDETDIEKANECIELFNNKRNINTYRFGRKFAENKFGLPQMPKKIR